MSSTELGTGFQMQLQAMVLVCLGIHFGSVKPKGRGRIYAKVMAVKRSTPPVHMVREQSVQKGYNLQFEGNVL